MSQLPKDMYSLIVQSGVIMTASADAPSLPGRKPAASAGSVVDVPVWAWDKGIRRLDQDSAVPGSSGQRARVGVLYYILADLGRELERGEQVCLWGKAWQVRTVELVHDGGDVVRAQLTRREDHRGG